MIPFTAFIDPAGKIIIGIFSREFLSMLLVLFVLATPLISVIQNKKIVIHAKKTKLQKKCTGKHVSQD